MTHRFAPVLYWLDDGKFARAMKVADTLAGAWLVVDLTSGDGPSVIGKPDWFDAGYVAVYGGLVPECAVEGTDPGQWSYGVAAPKEPAPAESPAEPEEDNEYRSLDHACEILRGCVAPYSGEQAHKVAKALKQWRDKWAAAVDCIHPDERQTIADLRAKLAAAEETIRCGRDVVNEAREILGFPNSVLLSSAAKDVKDRLAAAEARIAAIVEWTHQYGASLCPFGNYADSFGDGMRAAKAQVSRIAELGKGGA